MKSQSILFQITIHLPKNKKDRHELAQKIADVHADVVLHSIESLHCSSKQKKELLNSILTSALHTDSKSC